MIANKTFMANAQNYVPLWHVIDAEGKPLGRVASEAATILRGKHTPLYTPHADCGDFVIIINAAKAVLTGNKINQKEYIRHTGWVGGLKRVKYSDLMATRPEFAMELAVKGMLPHTSLGRKQFGKLKVYAGAEHPHEAQIAESAQLVEAKKNQEEKPEKATKAPATKKSNKAEVTA